MLFKPSYTIYCGIIYICGGSIFVDLYGTPYYKIKIPKVFDLLSLCMKIDIPRIWLLVKSVIQLKLTAHKSKWFHDLFMKWMNHCGCHGFSTESPRPHHLPALSYTYEDVEKKRKKRRKKKKHHHRRHHGEAEEVVSNDTLSTFLSIL